jgi:polysaccharide biosynthesis protein PslH
MKILMVMHSPVYPPESGVMKRNYHLLVEAARRHDVSAIILGVQDRAAFDKACGHLCKKVVFVHLYRSRWMSRLRSILNLLFWRSEARALHVPSLQKAITSLLAAEQYDLVHVSTPFLMYHDFPAGTCLVSDAHNVEYDNVQRAYREARGPVRKIYYFIVYLALKRDEIRNIKKCRVLMATSQRDASMFQRHIPDTPIVVVPNGVDTQYFVPSEVPVQRNSIVFTGLMEYYPNEHGILYFLEKIFPLVRKRVPDARLYVVGANPSSRVLSHASDNVIVTGYVKDVRPYVDRAEVAVIPLLIGGGTRLKALEAIAMKKPIVTTSVGCEGLDLKDGETAIFADTPQAFADAVVTLLGNPSLRTELAQRAWERVLSRYRWESVGEELDRAFRIAGKPSTHISHEEKDELGH